MSLIVTSDLIELTKIGLNEVYLNEMNEPAGFYQRLFNVKDSNKMLEEELVMAGFGLVPEWNADGGKINYDKPLSGDRIQFTHTDFGLAWMISHKMLREDLYKKTSKELVSAASLVTKHTIEQDAANVFALGFADTGPDGKPFFSATHPRLDGGVIDNLLAASALSATALRVAVGRVRRGVNQRGQPIVYTLDSLMIPPELEFIAKEALQPTILSTIAGLTSTSDVGAAIPNVSGAIIPNVIVNPYLTSVGDYYIGASTKQRFTVFYWRERPWFDAWKDDETKGVGNSIAFAYSCGYTRPEGWWGSNNADS